MPHIAVLSVAHIHSKDYCKKLVELAGGPFVIWDEDAERGIRYAQTYGCAFEPDLEAVLADSSVDGFLVCAENTRHLPLLRKVLPVGKPTFCEKPLATSGAEAAEAYALAHRYGTKLLLGYFRPFDGQNRAVKKLLADGVFGKVTHISFRNGHNAAYGRWFDSPDLQWFTQPALSGGGALLDLGTHAVHLLRHLGGPVESVWANIVNCSGVYTDVDDYGLILMKFASGVIGRVEAGWIFTGAGGAGLEIVGSEKSLWTTPEKGMQLGIRNEAVTVEPLDARPDRVSRLLAAIEGRLTDEEIESDLVCAMDAAKIMEAAYASARSGSWVDVR